MKVSLQQTFSVSTILIVGDKVLKSWTRIACFNVHVFISKIYSCLYIFAYISFSAGRHRNSHSRYPEREIERYAHNLPLRRRTSMFGQVIRWGGRTTQTYYSSFHSIKSLIRHFYFYHLYRNLEVSINLPFWKPFLLHQGTRFMIMRIHYLMHTTIW